MRMCLSVKQYSGNSIVQAVYTAMLVGGRGRSGWRGGELTSGVPRLKQQIQDWGERGSAPEQ